MAGGGGAASGEHADAPTLSGVGGVRGGAGGHRRGDTPRRRADWDGAIVQLGDDNGATARLTTPRRRRHCQKRGWGGEGGEEGGGEEAPSLTWRSAARLWHLRGHVRWQQAAGTTPTRRHPWGGSGAAGVRKCWGSPRSCCSGKEGGGSEEGGVERVGDGMESEGGAHNEGGSHNEGGRRVGGRAKFWLAARTRLPRPPLPSASA